MQSTTLFSALLLCAATATAQAAETDDSIARGSAIYRRPGMCITCHQAQGNGVPAVYPPLTAGSWVGKDAELLVQIVLHGLQGPLVIGGKPFKSAMPGMAAQLKDQDIADVLSYVRSAWGNTGAAVSVEVVSKVRADHAARKTMWTAKELKIVDAKP